jgi:hypothetical protein
MLPPQCTFVFACVYVLLLVPLRALSDWLLGVLSRWMCLWYYLQYGGICGSISASLERAIPGGERTATRQ